VTGAFGAPFDLDASGSRALVCPTDAVGTPANKIAAARRYLRSFVMVAVARVSS
jgi:hypothetical protein